LAASIAVEAVRSGSRVELVGKVGDDPAGDAVMIALNRLGIGHVAILRDAAHPTATAVDAGPTELELGQDPDAATDTTTEAMSEPPAVDAADVGLALRYLPELAVIVAVHQPVDVLREATAASHWAETTLIVVVPSNATAPDFLADGVLVVAAEAAAESATGAAIGRYAAAIDQGTPAQRAFGEFRAAGATAEAGPGHEADSSGSRVSAAEFMQ
jgi:sugar/nucleoside kinase (ribokinase family)